MKLHLVVTGKWFDMVASGVKKEEYRLHNLYWHRRIMKQSFIIESVVFHRGYTNITHERECLKITEGFGRPEWGAPEGQVIILKLGKEVR